MLALRLRLEIGATLHDKRSDEFRKIVCVSEKKKKWCCIRNDGMSNVNSVRYDPILSINTTEISEGRGGYRPLTPVQIRQRSRLRLNIYIYIYCKRACISRRYAPETFSLGDPLAYGFFFTVQYDSCVCVYIYILNP